MSEIPKCLKCGGTELKPGTIASSLNRPYFVPDGGILRTVTLAGVELNAKMCLKCGLLQISADPEAVKASINQMGRDE